jgi:hypothetical protein
MDLDQGSRDDDDDDGSDDEFDEDNGDTIQYPIIWRLTSDYRLAEHSAEIDTLICGKDDTGWVEVDASNGKFYPITWH